MISLLKIACFLLALLWIGRILVASLNVASHRITARFLGMTSIAMAVLFFFAPSNLREISAVALFLLGLSLLNGPAITDQDSNTYKRFASVSLLALMCLSFLLAYLVIR